MPDPAVRFLLSNNLPGSATRFTADTASVFARLGITTTVLFPAVDWWDYRVFEISRSRGWRRRKSIARLARDVLVNIPLRRRWCGYRYHAVDARVRARRYLLTPSSLDWSESEITVVHPPYLIPHLLKRIPSARITLVTALHMNLEKAMRSRSPETAAWYTHWVARERLISIPRYTTSQTAREAAERLGISIRKVIYDGSVDLALFRPAPAETRREPVTVTLYCDPNVQKGQAVGVEAFRGLRALGARVRLCSVGRVKPEYAGVFDHNWGYLHAERLVQALQESEIFAYPSLWDGFPAPPLQAMACGVALVTTLVEGVTEYGVHEQNCLLCEPGDAEGMRAQIVRLVEDRDLRDRLRSQGRKTAERFDVEHSARELLEFLREIYEERDRT